MTSASTRHERPTAVVVGILYVLATAAGVAAKAVGAPTEAAAMAGHDAQVFVAALLLTTMAVACTGIAVMLFPVLARDAGTTIRHGLSCGYLASRVIESALFLVGVAVLLSSLSVSATPVAVTAGPAMDAVSDNAWVMGQTAFCVGAAALAWLLLRSGRVPAWLALWGLIAAPLMLVAGFLQPVTGDPDSVASTVLYAPLAIQEMVLAGWLMVRGFRPSRHVPAAPPAPPPAREPATLAVPVG